jgi:hypothetical protein
MQDMLHKEGITSIDVLKVDIEGSEEELFIEEADWLKCAKLIIAEFHPTLIDYPATVRAIAKRGFRHYPARTLFGDSMDMFMREDVAI